MGMLRSVCLDNFNATVVSLNGKVHLQNVTAGLKDLEDSVDFVLLLLIRVSHLGQLGHQVVFGKNAGLVKVVLDHAEEIWVLGIGHLLEPLGHFPFLLVACGGCEKPCGDRT